MASLLRADGRIVERCTVLPSIDVAGWQLLRAGDGFVYLYATGEASEPRPVSSRPSVVASITRQVAHVGAQAHRIAPCEATRAYEGGRRRREP
jgi:hypothetical protein